jgi:hypothetical protein
MTIEEILREVALNIRREDRSVDAYIDELLLYLNDMALRVIEELPAGSKIRERAMLRFLGGIESLLYDGGGLDERVQSVQDIFDLQREVSERLFEDASDARARRRLDAESESSLGIYVGTRTAIVAAAIGMFASSLREGVVESIFAERPIRTAELIKAAGEQAKKYLKFELTASITAHNQMVLIEQALALGVPFVLYAGPLDEKNRPFCSARAKRIFPIREIFTWRNDNREPAWIYRGGWGCRHLLVPVRSRADGA